MNPAFFKAKPKVDASKRFGIAKGYMDECKIFDKWNDEIADLFERKTS